MMRRASGRLLDRGVMIFVGIILAIAVAVPVLNQAFPPSSPLHLPIYLVALFGKYVCYALLALSIDLIWGYCGILSLGHGAFFALGGYAMGMYLMRQIGTRGVYANPILPDFMVFLNWPELPIYWYGFQHFAYALLMIVLVPGTLAFVFGWFAFRSRVTGVYLSIITQALTFALMLGFFRNNFGFGGNNGLTDFKDILGFNVQSPGTRVALFSISCLALVIGILICRAVITSKFGKVLVAIRDAENRVRFLGYRVESYKLFVFTLSACMAGVAGALYVPQLGIINPSEFSPANSIEAVLWVAVGGRGTLIGAAIGALVVNYAKTFFTSGTLVPYWILGLLTLAVFGGLSIQRRQTLIGFAIGAVIGIVSLPLAAGTNFDGPPIVAGLALLVAMGWNWHPWPVGTIFGALAVEFFMTPAAVLGLAPYWLFALGGLFVAVTLLLPNGLVGTMQEWWTRRGTLRAAKVAEATEPTPQSAARAAE